MKKTIKLGIITLSLAAIFGVIINSTPTYADIPTIGAKDASDAIVKKWMITDFYSCLQQGNINTPLSPYKTTTGAYNTTTSLALKGGLVADSVFEGNGGSAPMPSYGFFSGIDGGTRSCKDIYKGFSKGGFNFAGVLSYKGIDGNAITWNNIKDATNLLESTGYTKIGDDYVIQIHGTIDTYEYNTKGKVIIAGKNYDKRGETDTVTMTLRVENGQKPVITAGNVVGATIKEDNGYTLEININDDEKVSIPITNSASDTEQQIKSKLANKRPIRQFSQGVMGGASFLYQIVFSETEVQEGSEFKFGDKALSNVAAEMGGWSDISDFNLTEDERYELYRFYFSKVVSDVGKEYHCGSDVDKSSMRAVRLKNGDNKWVEYWFYTSDIVDLEFNDIFGGSPRPDPIDTEFIIEWFNKHPVDAKASEECESPPKEAISANTGNAEADDVDCWNSAGSLGWILCPVIEFAKETITAVYDSIVTNFLEISPTLFNDAGPIYGTWQTFQSIANVIFVIVFLVVIFSQLTGVGIDNLGIKRILPKLIVAAIIINLSYIICMLLVDISNILGVGLNNFFVNIKVADVVVEGEGASAAMSTIMTAAVGGAVGFLAFNPVSLGIWGSVVVPFLVIGLIVALFGILFFFVLLGFRQAAIIMLIIVSPVAFACYMLPNTKQFFDRWKKMFEGLLLLYPICGILMGGSSLASKILLDLDTGFLGKLIAMLVGVVPFFFIPSLLRSSFAAMGNIGAKISGFGRGLGNRVTGAVARSKGMEEMQTRMRAGIDRNGNQTSLGKYRELTAQGKTRLSKVPGMRRMAERANYAGEMERKKMNELQRRRAMVNSPGYKERAERQEQMALNKELLQTNIDTLNDSTNKGAVFAAKRDSDGNVLEGEKLGVYDYFTQAAIDQQNDSNLSESQKDDALVMAKAAINVAGRAPYATKEMWDPLLNDVNNGKFGNKAMETIAKEITSGDNSKNYRVNNAFGYEYMDQINKGSSSVKVRNGDGTYRYKTFDEWSQSPENLHTALDHHINSEEQLLSQSNSSLKRINNYLDNNGKYSYQKTNADGTTENVEVNDKATYAKLAASTIAKQKANLMEKDISKDTELSSMAGKLVNDSSTKNKGDWAEGEDVATRDQNPATSPDSDSSTTTTTASSNNATPINSSNDSTSRDSSDDSGKSNDESDGETGESDSSGESMNFGNNNHSDDAESSNQNASKAQQDAQRKEQTNIQAQITELENLRNTFKAAMDGTDPKTNPGKYNMYKTKYNEADMKLAQLKGEGKY